MRVLLVTGSFPPMKCGVGDYTKSLAMALRGEENLAVAVLTDGSSSTLDRTGIEVYPIARGWCPHDAKTIYDMSRKWKPDIVHIQYPTQGYGGNKLPWVLPTYFHCLGYPVVQTWHEFISVRWQHWSKLITPGGLVVVRGEMAEWLSHGLSRFMRNKILRHIPNAPSIPAIQMTEGERDRIRRKFAGNRPVNLVSFFGFAYPNKNIESLFSVADPSKDFLLLICELDPGNDYQRNIIDRINNPPWQGRAVATGFLQDIEVARLLATSDAAVFPFAEGGGPWNTSLQAASIQGTFVITTSTNRNGYDPVENVHYSAPGDVTGMREALLANTGRRIPPRLSLQQDEWRRIASAHLSLYRETAGRNLSVLGRQRSHGGPSRISSR